MDNLSNPLISIIVNCFNGEKYLRKALESILNISKKEIDELSGFSKSILPYLSMPAAGQMMLLKMAKKK